MTKAFVLIFALLSAYGPHAADVMTDSMVNLAANTLNKNYEMLKQTYPQGTDMSFSQFVFAKNDKEGDRAFFIKAALKEDILKPADILFLVQQAYSNTGTADLKDIFKAVVIDNLKKGHS